jgi:dTDP-4-dehydrorhamnose reductase
MSVQDYPYFKRCELHRTSFVARRSKEPFVKTLIKKKKKHTTRRQPVRRRKPG